MKKVLLILLSVAAFISLGISIAGTYAEFKQNAMYEFCIDNVDNPCITNWSYLLTVALSWFLHFFLRLIVVVFVIWSAYWMLVKKRAKKHIKKTKTKLAPYENKSFYELHCRALIKQ